MGPTVLVVDDVADVREVLCYALELEGYRTVQAASGIEALEKADVHRPAIIVMDLGMLPTDGIEASRRLKRDPQLRDIPIIAYTAFPPEISLTDLFVAVLAKPCPLERVLHTIAQHQPSRNTGHVVRAAAGNSLQST